MSPFCILVVTAAALAGDPASAVKPVVPPGADPNLPKPINVLCPVGAEPVVMMREDLFTYQGLTLGVCCPECIPPFLNDWTQQQRDEFVLRHLQPIGGVCPLDGKPAADTGPASLYHGFRIGFCCEICRANFDKKPDADKDAFLAKHVAPVNAAAVCPVSGRASRPDAPAVSWNAVVIRFCCEKCAAKWATMDGAGRDALASKALAAAPPAAPGSTPAGE